MQSLSVARKILRKALEMSFKQTFTPGQKGTILSISKKDPVFRCRLLTMGAIPGTSFEVLRVAPLGDPIELRIRGTLLAIRRSETELIDVEFSNNEPTERQ